MPGRPFAGLAPARVGPVAAFGCDAASFAISALSLSLIRLRMTRADRSGDGAETQNVLASRLAELVAGARFLWDQPILSTDASATTA